MTTSRFDRRTDVLLSCHIPVNICALTFGSGNNPRKCVNQHLSAVTLIYPLDKRFRSASVTPHVLSVRDYWKGRADKTALTDRRRQSCRTPSKPSWPLASSPFSLPALSRKSPWKSPWSWKSQLWRSSDSELSRPGRQPRPNPGIGSQCKFSAIFFFSCSSRRCLPAPNAKSLCWSCHEALTGKRILTRSAHLKMMHSRGTLPC